MQAHIDFETYRSVVFTCTRQSMDDIRHVGDEPRKALRYPTRKRGTESPVEPFFRAHDGVSMTIFLTKSWAFRSSDGGPHEI